MGFKSGADVIHKRAVMEIKQPNDFTDGEGKDSTKGGKDGFVFAFGEEKQANDEYDECVRCDFSKAQNDLVKVGIFASKCVKK